MGLAGPFVTVKRFTWFFPLDAGVGEVDQSLRSWPKYWRLCAGNKTPYRETKGTWRGEALFFSLEPVQGIGKIVAREDGRARR